MQKRMSETISVTEIGRKYFEIKNIPFQAQSQTMCPKQSQACVSELPTIRKNGSEPQFHPLHFRLNQLYKTSGVVASAKRQYSQSVKVVQDEMLKDLGYSNEYTKKRAHELVVKLMGKSGKQEEKVSINMQISKNRNYLARINYLHCQRNFNFDRIKKSLEKSLDKENME